jgi:hypothetical protein
MATATTAIVDTNPAFWEQWEQLGHAVVAQAVEDYANARKIIETRATAYEKQATGSDHYNPVADIARYERFFRSRYFACICPTYDGHELFDILKSGGWRMVHRVRHFTPKAGVERTVVDTRKGRRNNNA